MLQVKNAQMTMSDEARTLRIIQKVVNFMYPAHYMQSVDASTTRYHTKTRLSTEYIFGSTMQLI